jgi:hypothetical protein
MRLVWLKQKAAIRLGAPCSLSGVIMEADHQTRTRARLRPHLGFDRL